MRFVCSLRLSKFYRPRPSCRHCLGLLAQNHQLIAAQRQHHAGVRHSYTVIQPLKIVAASFLVISEERSFSPFVRAEKDVIFECGPRFIYKLASD
jgi:hypothetical protein